MALQDGPVGQLVTELLPTIPVWAQYLVSIATIFLLAFLVNRFLDVFLEKGLSRAKRRDPTAERFVSRILHAGVYALAAVWILSTLGVDPTALLGGLAIGGFVVGFAVKDTLSNFAAGITLLFTRPYSVGETVTLDGMDGDVLEIGISLTTIKAADGRIITIPNARVLSQKVINHTRNPIRRADVVVGIPYAADLAKAVAVITEALEAHPKVLAEPKLSIRVTGLDASSVGLQVRPWVATSEYWPTQAELRGVVKEALQRNGIEIPFPQAEVRLLGGMPSGQ